MILSHFIFIFFFVISGVTNADVSIGAHIDNNNNSLNKIKYEAVNKLNSLSQKEFFLMDLVESPKTLEYVLFLGDKEIKKHENYIAKYNVFSLINENKCQLLKGKFLYSNVVCITKNNSFRLFFKLAKHVFPEKKKLVVMLPFGMGDTLRDEDTYGMELITIEASEDGVFNLKELRQVLDRDSVFVALPYLGLYRSDNVREILINTYYSNVPVLSFSKSLARSGASVSLYQTIDTASQNISNAIINMPKSKNNNFEIIEPRIFEININERVMNSLGLAVPTSESIELFKKSAFK